MNHHVTEIKPTDLRRRELDAAFDQFDALVRKSAAVPKGTVLYTTDAENSDAVNS